jgi:nucleoside-diphosphate-sugar epimerase
VTFRRIVVTGAGGFVAHHLLPRLADRFPGAAVVQVGGHAGRVDITDAAAVAQFIDANVPDACIHLAAVSHVPSAASDPDLAWRVNLHGTLNLARAVQKANPACVFLFVSSGEVYGRSFAAGVALDETGLPAPMNTYAATKAAADLAIGAMACSGLRAIRLRPFNQTGVGQAANFVVPAFARQVARIAAGMQPPTMQVGALDPCRDFLDVRDVCDAYVACLAHADRIAPGSIFNIASGVPRRIGDILQALQDLAGVRADVTTVAGLLRRAEIATAIGDATAARQAFGWAPRVAWEQTLADVLADWRERAAAEKPAA